VIEKGRAGHQILAACTTRLPTWSTASVGPQHVIDRHSLSRTEGRDGELWKSAPLILGESLILKGGTTSKSVCDRDGGSRTIGGTEERNPDLDRNGTLPAAAHRRNRGWRRGIHEGK